MVKMVKRLLYFIEDENDKPRKTERWNVYSMHSHDFLGKIHWRSGWRCYVMSYSDDIDMSIGCHDELNEFMKELEDKRTSKS